MEAKKNPKISIERKKSTYFQIGLIVALGFTLVAFEWTTYGKRQGNTIGLIIDDIDPIMMPITMAKPTPPPPPKKVIPPTIEIIDDEKEIVEMDIDFGDFDDDIIIDPIPFDDELLVEEPKILHFAQHLPAFPGGERELFKFLAQELKYPQIAKESGIQGTVYIQYAVLADGSLQDIKILRGIGGGCDEAAIKAIKKMPKWIPGRQNGRNVAVYVKLPVKFTLRN